MDADGERKAKLGNQVVDRILKLWTARRPGRELTVEGHRIIINAAWALVQVVASGVHEKIVLRAHREFKNKPANVQLINEDYCRDVLLPMFDRLLVLEDMAEL